MEEGPIKGSQRTTYKDPLLIKSSPEAIQLKFETSQHLLFQISQMISFPFQNFKIGKF